MSRTWRIIISFCLAFLLLGLVLIAVAYMTGGGFDHLIKTTDVFDMTKFFTREQIDSALSIIFKE